MSERFNKFLNFFYTGPEYVSEEGLKYLDKKDLDIAISKERGEEYDKSSEVKIVVVKVGEYLSENQEKKEEEELEA